jgi:hypothetical protein
MSVGKGEMLNNVTSNTSLVIALIDGKIAQNDFLNKTLNNK